MADCRFPGPRQCVTEDGSQDREQGGSGRCEQGQGIAFYSTKIFEGKKKKPNIMQAS